VLAKPLLAARILTDNQQPDLFNDLGDGGDRVDEIPERDRRQQAGAIDPALREAILREVARRLDPAAYAPPVLLHVHLSEEALRTEPGTLVWRTKLGRTLITNPSGTFDLGNAEFAHATWCAARQLTSHSAA
jgi:hypothetical protein